MNVHSSSAELTRIGPLGLRARIASLTLAEAGTISTFATVGLLAVRPTSDPDKFWHLATGRWIWENGRIPKTDPFSWTTPGRNWVAHEWLTEAVWFRIYQLAGWMGLAILSAVIIVSALLLTYRSLRSLGASALTSNALILTGALASLVTWGVRPQMLSFLLVALVCRLTIQGWHTSVHNAPGAAVHRKRLWLLVPVMLLWANAHGAYLFGIALLGAFAVGLTLDHLLTRSTSYRNFRKLSTLHGDTQLIRTSWAVTTACIAVTLVNPHGVAGLMYPFSYLGDNASTRYVAEWFAPNFGEARFWPFAVVLGLSAFALVRLRRVIPLFAIIQIIALAGLGLQSARNITPFVAVALPWIGLSLRRNKEARTITKPKSAGAIHTGLAVTVVAVFAALGAPSIRSSAVDANDARHFPRAATTWIGSNPRPRMLNQYDWGGYFILNLPEVPVSVDGRPDMYGDPFMDRYVSIWSVHNGWERRLDEDGYERVVGAPRAPIVRELRSRPGWRVVYEDAQAVVLDRL